MTGSCCIKCGKLLTFNEAGANKKFINRACTSFLCYDCLAEKLDVNREILMEKIEHFKRQGCTLFT